MAGGSRKVVQYTLRNGNGGGLWPDVCWVVRAIVLLSLAMQFQGVEAAPKYEDVREARVNLNGFRLKLEGKCVIEKDEVVVSGSKNAYLSRVAPSENSNQRPFWKFIESDSRNPDHREFVLDQICLLCPGHLLDSFFVLSLWEGSMSGEILGGSTPGEMWTVPLILEDSPGGERVPEVVLYAIVDATKDHLQSQLKQEIPFSIYRRLPTFSFRIPDRESVELAVAERNANDKYEDDVKVKAEVMIGDEKRQQRGKCVLQKDKIKITGVAKIYITIFMIPHGQKQTYTIVSVIPGVEQHKYSQIYQVFTGVKNKVMALIGANKVYTVHTHVMVGSTKTLRYEVQCVKLMLDMCPHGLVNSVIVFIHPDNKLGDVWKAGRITTQSHTHTSNDPHLYISVELGIPLETVTRELKSKAPFYRIQLPKKYL